jgi:simple sugar transport system substrate-binding protein
MRKLLFAASAIGALILGVSGYVAAQDKPVIATVVKISGIPWFNRMEVGVKAFQDANPDVVTSESGPATADAAQQLQIVEDLIARGVNALAVVPMDPAVIEGALKRAMDRGIVVVTHEADNQKNTQADIEAFDNATYGATLNERLAQCMGGKGKWTNFVGSLGSRTHIQWVDAGAENAKKHPGMELVDEKNESFDDVKKPTRRQRKSYASTPTSVVSKDRRATMSSALVGRSKRRACRARCAWWAPVFPTRPLSTLNPAPSRRSASGIRGTQAWP